MRDMADELLKLYATRQMVQGHAFGKDSPWQFDFEDAFEFDETEDQISAIEDVKSDMESRKPMDRLLCGDVGYGKTERSEERRVGKECRSRWSAYHEKKK